jgi:shikimate dehydrogenase
MVSTHLAVLGSPIEHSKSPAIHAAAYEALGLDWDYGRYRVEANELPDFLRLRDETWRGLSLTMPLKDIGFELSIPSCPVASETSVVNTLLHTDDGWEGYNTDSFGIQKAVSEHTDQKFQVVNVLGSGATARSAIHAAGQLFPDAEIRVFARKSIELFGFATQALENFKANEISGLTISTLPSGLFGERLNVTDQAVILDVAYDPWPSKLSSNWQPSNRISGVEMLLWQALIQLRIFVNGDGTAVLDNETDVFSAMSNAVKPL